MSHRPYFGCRWTLAGFIGLLALLASALVSAGVLHPGHSGHWFVPERSGEGWVLEILDEQRALVYWFTYDEAGNQRWLIGEGTIREDDEGWYLDFPDMYLTRGPAFGPDYDPSSLVIEVVGDGEMRFTDCDHGLFEFEGLDQDLAFPVQRLTRTMGADCSAPLHGRPGEPLQPYAGHSGSWYEPASSGQGFALQWMTNDHAVVTWFTYDAEGNQQWMLGVGRHEDDRVVFSDLHATRGGRFGADFDPDSVERLHWGELELELACHGGPARYASDQPEFGSGTLELNRLTRLMQPAGCPAETPQLQEVYAIGYVELPVNNEGEAPRTEAMQIAADGTVAGGHPGPFGSSTMFRILGWGEPEWRTIEDDGRTSLLFLADDLSLMAFNVFDGWTDEGLDRWAPRLWQTDAGGTQSLPGQILDHSLVRAGSSDGACLVGTGRERRGELEHPWKWNTDEGQQLLPERDDIGGGAPTGCSSDGEVVIGNRPLGESAMREDIAMRWVGDAEPEFLYDDYGARLRFAQACSADCAFIVGGDQVDLDPDHPHYREPWYWTETGGATYLGMPPDAHLIGIAPVTAWDVSADGSLIVGSYAVENPWDGSTGSRAFAWTETTGLVNVPELLEKHGPGEDNWQRMSAVSVAEGDDGIRILLSGEHRYPPWPHSYARRAAVLHLSPHEDGWFD